MSTNKETQEKYLLEDLLLNLIGCDGNYIKRKENPLFETKEKEKEEYVSNLLFNKQENKFIKLNLLRENNQLDQEVKKFTKIFEIEPYLDKSTHGIFFIKITHLDIL